MTRTRVFSYDPRNVVLGGIVGLIITVILVHSSTIERTWYNLPFFCLISMPIPLRGNLYSLWGGVGRSDVISLFGFYQDAGRDALSLFGIVIYQRAGNNAVQGVTLNLYQEAGSHKAAASQIVGFRKSNEREAVQWISISVVQKAYYDAGQAAGLIIYQQAGQEAMQFAGLALVRKAKIITRFFAFTFFPKIS
jgi:hypothetical protein